MKHNALLLLILRPLLVLAISAPLALAFGDEDEVEVSTNDKIVALELLLKGSRDPQEQFKTRAELITQLLTLKTPADSRKARSIAEVGLKARELTNVQKAVFLHLITQSYLNEKPEKAMKYFTDALAASRTYPGSGGALLVLAEHYFEKEKFGQALPLYRELSKRKDVPLDYVAVKHGFCALKAQKFQESEEAFIGLIEKDQGSDKLDTALEGLATATAFTRSEKNLRSLIDRLFAGKRKLQAQFVSLALKKRAVVRKESEPTLFDDLLSFAADDQQLDQTLGDQLASLEGSWPPERLVANLERFRLRKRQARPIADPGIAQTVEREVGHAIASLHQSRRPKKAGSGRALEFLTAFALDFLPTSKIAKDAALIRVEVCRETKSYSCLEEVSTKSATRELLPEKVRLSLRLETALKGKSVADVAKITDQALIHDVVVGLKGEKIWRQVMPHLIESERAKHNPQLALRWADDFLADQPSDPEAQYLYLSLLAENDKFDILQAKLAGMRPDRSTQETVARALGQKLKATTDGENWAASSQILDILLSMEAVSKKEKGDSLGFVASRLLAHGKDAEAEKLMMKNRADVEFGEAGEKLVKRSLSRSIAKGAWEACLKISAPQSARFAFERALCELGQANGRIPASKLEVKNLSTESRKYLFTLLASFAPDTLLALTDKTPPRSSDEESVTYFAYQMQQRNLFPVLSPAQFARVSKAAPPFLKASGKSKIEAELEKSNFPRSSVAPPKYLEQIVALDQTSTEIKRRIEAVLNKVDLRDQVRIFRSAGEFERDLAKAIANAPFPGGGGGAEKRKFTDEMKALSKAHLELSKQYLRFASQKNSEYKEAVESYYPRRLELTEPHAWSWPGSAIAARIRAEVRAKRVLGAYLILDYSRAEKLLPDDEYYALKTLVLLTGSRSEAMKMRVLSELGNAKRLEILSRHKITKGG